MAHTCGKRGSSPSNGRKLSESNPGLIASWERGEDEDDTQVGSDLIATGVGDGGDVDNPGTRGQAEARTSFSRKNDVGDSQAGVGMIVCAGVNGGVGHNPVESKNKLQTIHDVNPHNRHFSSEDYEILRENDESNSPGIILSELSEEEENNSSILIPRVDDNKQFFDLNIINANARSLVNKIFVTLSSKSIFQVK